MCWWPRAILNTGGWITLCQLPSWKLKTFKWRNLQYRFCPHVDKLIEISNFTKAPYPHLPFPSLITSFFQTNAHPRVRAQEAGWERKPGHSSNQERGCRETKPSPSSQNQLCENYWLEASSILESNRVRREAEEKHLTVEEAENLAGQWPQSGDKEGKGGPTLQSWTPVFKPLLPVLIFNLSLHFHPFALLSLTAHRNTSETRVRWRLHKPLVLRQAFKTLSTIRTPSHHLCEKPSPQTTCAW